MIIISIYFIDIWIFFMSIDFNEKLTQFENQINDKAEILAIKSFMNTEVQFPVFAINVDKNEIKAIDNYLSLYNDLDGNETLLIDDPKVKEKIANSINQFKDVDEMVYYLNYKQEDFLPVPKLSHIANVKLAAVNAMEDILNYIKNIETDDLNEINESLNFYDDKTIQSFIGLQSIAATLNGVNFSGDKESKTFLAVKEGVISVQEFNANELVNFIINDTENEVTLYSVFDTKCDLEKLHGNTWSNDLKSEVDCDKITNVKMGREDFNRSNVMRMMKEVIATAYTDSVQELKQEIDLSLEHTNKKGKANKI